MATPLTEIRNVGPAVASELERAGIRDAETLRALGADKAYEALLAAGSPPHFIAYYALVMGLQGRPWNDCRGAEKAALRVTFDRIRAAAAPARAEDGLPRALSDRLDRIGVRRRGDGT